MYEILKYRIDCLNDKDNYKSFRIIKNTLLDVNTIMFELDIRITNTYSEEINYSEGLIYYYLEKQSVINKMIEVISNDIKSNAYLELLDNKLSETTMANKELKELIGKMIDTDKLYSELKKKKENKVNSNE